MQDVCVIKLMTLLNNERKAFDESAVRMYVNRLVILKSLYNSKTRDDVKYFIISRFCELI